ncbi:TauD/TfdA dioxygenase family protein [Sphingomonas hengshuiensis]|uniref:Taurine dioxygenase n=1 Tax=Sphingomonas hengshuiensis TaxID=1609977 RepID=A0A7U4LEK2_9SPHN|nr:TauD/TfdA family dioxygenase [Sphingomonas hengshuiensis]AJP71293.1 taurine dioxygenase [Sphingomonas hengshuiensis]
MIAIHPLTPHMGAEIDGIDLTAPLSEAQGAALRAALAEHLVLFFRDQPIGHDQHKALARVFGDIHVAAATAAWAVPGHPEVTRMHTDAGSTYVPGEDWHSDMTCDPEPPLGSILYLHTVPETGGDTAFSNMFAAYAALSDRMKAYLDGLTATHDAARVFGAIAPAGTRFNMSSHPVVRTHPVSGRKALFVNKQFTAKIDGVPKDESAALLAFLAQHVQRPEFQCRFRWRPHSIAFWDNRSVQHSAIWDYFPQTRSGYRVTVKGDRPF